MKAQMTKWLYAAQQKLAITGPEAAFVAGVVLILTVGFTMTYLQGRGVAFPPETYASLDDEVAERAARSVEEALAALAQSGGSDEAADAPGVAGASAGGAMQSPAARTPRGRLGPVRMDPNTASAAMLERLPGIGPALAARIVEHREQHGPFRRPRDIINVRGIGPATFERLEPYLYIGEVADPASRQE